VLNGGVVKVGVAEVVVLGNLEELIEDQIKYILAGPD
jgi:hypothetical protein